MVASSSRAAGLFAGTRRACWLVSDGLIRTAVSMPP
jgi:hypothetical protein